MTLHALSPLDGRYENETSPLREFFSEFAYLRTRVRIELNFLDALSKTGLISAETLSKSDLLQSISVGQFDLQSFTEDDARKIQEYEKTTRHDVKAIEYFLRDKIPSRFHPWLHFGLTSEDVNSIA